MRTPEETGIILCDAANILYAQRGSFPSEYLEAPEAVELLQVADYLNKKGREYLNPRPKEER